MQIGDTLPITPTFDTTYGMPGDSVPLPAKVVYIHPQRRFYTVRFTVPGGSWTETRPCNPCELDRRKDKRKHENDCNYEQQGRRGKDRHRHQSG
ncbi:hypothetical protein [Oscillibacter sp.]|uniref:hypothetical protein n=1 Tax=Oscillibacter sp. TaxID=1945593 RepID=UPI0028A261A0|nr:hypothetical protein [Oscillibacter sp.]